MTEIMAQTALILEGSLKKAGAESHTNAISGFFAEKARAAGIECEILRLVERVITPGTSSDEGPGDEWPEIFAAILAADIIIFATPVWWGTHSSEVQKAIERLDPVHDAIMQGKASQLEGKMGGVIVTGDGDGAEHIIGMMANFFNALGVMLPPYTSLSALTPKHAKDSDVSREELMQLYEKDYAGAARTMIEQYKKYDQFSGL